MPTFSKHTQELINSRSCDRAEKQQICDGIRRMEEREADSSCEWIQWVTLFWDGERGGIPLSKGIKELR